MLTTHNDVWKKVIPDIYHILVKKRKMDQKKNTRDFRIFSLDGVCLSVMSWAYPFKKAKKINKQNTERYATNVQMCDCTK